MSRCAPLLEFTLRACVPRFVQFDRGYYSPYFVTDPERMVSRASASTSVCAHVHAACYHPAIHQSSKSSCQNRRLLFTCNAIWSPGYVLTGV